jgi:hypothetical protein
VAVAIQGSRSGPCAAVASAVALPGAAGPGRGLCPVRVGKRAREVVWPRGALAAVRCKRGRFRNGPEEPGHHRGHAGLHARGAFGFSFAAVEGARASPTPHPVSAAGWSASAWRFCPPGCRQVPRRGGWQGQHPLVTTVSPQEGCRRGTCMCLFMGLPHTPDNLAPHPDLPHPAIPWTPPRRHRCLQWWLHSWGWAGCLPAQGTQALCSACHQLHAALLSLTLKFHVTYCHPKLESPTPNDT